MECVDAGIVPSISSVQQGKNRARIDERIKRSYTPLEAPADCFACCSARRELMLCEYAQATRRSGVKFPLRLVIWCVRMLFFQPIADGRFRGRKIPTLSGHEPP